MVYLDVVARASFAGAGPAYILPSERPDGGCLIGALYDLALSLQDAVLNEDEVQQLWAANGTAAYTAYLMASEGASSPLFDGIYLAHGLVSRHEASVVRSYHRIRDAEPSGSTQKVRYIVQTTVTTPILGLARLVELGAVARDVLFADISAAAVPTQSDRVGAFKYRSLAFQAFGVLAAVNDTRLQALPTAARDTLHPKSQSLILSLAAQQTGALKPEFDRTFVFWKNTCVTHPPVFGP